MELVPIKPLEYIMPHDPVPQRILNASRWFVVEVLELDFGDYTGRPSQHAIIRVQVLSYLFSNGWYVDAVQGGGEGGQWKSVSGTTTASGGGTTSETHSSTASNAAGKSTTEGNTRSATEGSTRSQTDTSVKSHTNTGSHTDTSTNTSSHTDTDSANKTLRNHTHAHNDTQSSSGGHASGRSKSNSSSSSYSYADGGLQPGGGQTYAEAQGQAWARSDGSANSHTSERTHSHTSTSSNTSSETASSSQTSVNSNSHTGSSSSSQTNVSSQTQSNTSSQTRSNTSSQTQSSTNTQNSTKSQTHSTTRTVNDGTGTSATESEGPYWYAYVRIRLKRRKLQAELVMKDMVEDLTKAYNEGRKINDDRYDELVNLYAIMLGRTEDEGNDFMLRTVDIQPLADYVLRTMKKTVADFHAVADNLPDEVFRNRVREINLKFDNQVSKARTDLITAGLFNSTVWITTASGIERNREMALNDLIETKIDVYVKVAGAAGDIGTRFTEAAAKLQKMAQERMLDPAKARNEVFKWMLDFMERRKDEFPGIDQIAGAAKQLGYAETTTSNGVM